MKGTKVTAKTKNKTTIPTKQKKVPPLSISKKDDDKITVDSISNFINEPTTDWPQWSIDVIEPEANVKRNNLPEIKRKGVKNRELPKVDIKAKRRWFNRGRIDIDEI